MTDQLLSQDSVLIGLPSSSMEDAISKAGGMLVDRGNVEPSYVDGMLERERTVSTYLGNGVAMPHGTFESKEAVLSTGIVVLQYPDGIDWGGNGTAHLVIGLGAVGDDHVNVLSHIADVLQDEELAEQLWTTSDQEFLHSTLNAPVGDDDDTSTEGTITISGQAGLHARPATMIVELTKAFEGDVVITKNDREAKANSIMSVLALGATANDTIHVAISGSDTEARENVLAEIERILTTPESEL